MSQKQNLRERPSKAGEETRRDGKQESGKVEIRLAEDHHYHAQCHAENNERELDGWRFEAEEESEYKDEDEDGRFTHGIECQGDCLKGGIAEADIEGGCGAAGDEAGEVEEWCDEGFRGLDMVSVSVSWVWLLDFWSEGREDEKHSGG